MMRATATAHPNIALVKYWGKRDVSLNLPAAGSLSLTLSPIQSVTTVALGQDADRVVIDGQVVSDKVADRTLAFVRLVMHLAGEAGVSTARQGGISVESANDFPTAAGLASSSSGFAALAAATCAALGWEVDNATLSVLARRGSGSAARSIYGGFVEMLPGEAPDGRDGFAVPVADVEHWDLRCLIALTATGPKKMGSTEAMTLTAETSPYHQAWINSVAPDIAAAKVAVLNRDFAALATIAERSCLRMHAAAMGSEPGILYWNGRTVDLIHAVRTMRADGLPAFFTIDAGPHVKVFTPATHAEQVEAELRRVAGVRDVIVARPGPALSVVKEG